MAGWKGKGGSTVRKKGNRSRPHESDTPHEQLRSSGALSDDVGSTSSAQHFKEGGNYSISAKHRKQAEKAKKKEDKLLEKKELQSKEDKSKANLQKQTSLKVPKSTLVPTTTLSAPKAVLPASHTTFHASTGTGGQLLKEGIQVTSTHGPGAPSSEDQHAATGTISTQHQLPLEPEPADGAMMGTVADAAPHGNAVSADIITSPLALPDIDESGSDAAIVVYSNTNDFPLSSQEAHNNNRPAQTHDANSKLENVPAILEAPAVQETFLSLVPASEGSDAHASPLSICAHLQSFTAARLHAADGRADIVQVSHASLPDLPAQVTPSPGSLSQTNSKAPTDNSTASSMGPIVPVEGTRTSQRSWGAGLRGLLSPRLLLWAGASAASSVLALTPITRPLAPLAAALGELASPATQQGATNDPAEGQTDKDANDSSKAGLLGSVSRLLAPRNCLAAAASLARTAMPSSHGQLLQPARAALSLRLWLPHPRASISQMRTSTMKACGIPSRKLLTLLGAVLPRGLRQRLRNATPAGEVPTLRLLVTEASSLISDGFAAHCPKPLLRQLSRLGAPAVSIIQAIQVTCRPADHTTSPLELAGKVLQDLAGKVVAILSPRRYINACITSARTAIGLPLQLLYAARSSVKWVRQARRSALEVAAACCTRACSSAYALAKHVQALLSPGTYLGLCEAAAKAAVNAAQLKQLQLALSELAHDFHPRTLLAEVTMLFLGLYF